MSAINSSASLTADKTAQYLGAATQAEQAGPAMHTEGTNIPETETFIASELALCDSLEHDVITLSPELGLAQDRSLDTLARDTGTDLAR